MGQVWNANAMRNQSVSDSMFFNWDHQPFSGLLLSESDSHRVTAANMYFIEFS